MKLSSLLLIFATTLGVIYLLLAFVAMRHIKQEKKILLSKIWPMYLYYWPFYGDLFLDSAKKLRRFGFVVLVGSIVTYMSWFDFKG